MSQFNPQIIANLLLVGVVLVIAVRGFFAWCKRVDGRPAYDPLRDGPLDTASIVEQAGIRRTLPRVNKAEYEADALAETYRVSKLS